MNDIKSKTLKARFAGNPFVKKYKKTLASREAGRDAKKAKDDIPSYLRRK